MRGEGTLLGAADDMDGQLVRERKTRKRWFWNDVDEKADGLLIVGACMYN